MAVPTPTNRRGEVSGRMLRSVLLSTVHALQVHGKWHVTAGAGLSTQVATEFDDHLVTSSI